MKRFMRTHEIKYFLYFCVSLKFILLDTQFRSCIMYRTLWNAPACFTDKDMFPRLYFVSAPNKVFFMSYIHYGKTRLFR